MEEKAKLQKDSQISLESTPLCINYPKFLFEDIRQSVVEFARVKLSQVSPVSKQLLDSDEFRVFRAVVMSLDTEVTHSFQNVQAFTVQQIKVACESARISLKQKRGEVLDKAE
mmetsp:Transcript_2667/g.4486  ORF Transcript_2667/g.4486 Transcript_2667/m.4486 type:complete len:113 (-) Transcript_2667:662-1000(-)